jgi:thiol-disulfide isomerase/thioredoxin
MRLTSILALTVCLMGAGCRDEARHMGDAPDVSLKTYVGETYTVSARDGKVTLLVFWATWCQPCLMEIPTLVELQNKFSGRGFRVVAINVDDPEGSKVRPILVRLKVNYTVLAGNEHISQDFGGVYALPTNFIIGRDGKLKDKMVGLEPPGVLESKIAAEL